MSENLGQLVTSVSNVQTLSRESFVITEWEKETATRLCLHFAMNFKPTNSDAARESGKDPLCACIPNSTVLPVRRSTSDHLIPC
jgi:hypothetical protein